MLTFEMRKIAPLSGVIPFLLLETDHDAMKADGGFDDVFIALVGMRGHERHNRIFFFDDEQVLVVFKIDSLLESQELAAVGAGCVDYDFLVLSIWVALHQTVRHVAATRENQYDYLTSKKRAPQRGAQR